jgi:casein kinase II subunit alpha
MKLRGIRKEVKLLRTVHDHPYIAELVDVIRAPDTGFISIVYNYYETEKEGTSDLFVALTDKGNRFFLFKVLKAIDYAHSRGVIHGDIKPLNIIANSESKMLKIIDWGLGNFYRPGAIMSTHIGTRYLYIYF